MRPHAPRPSAPRCHTSTTAQRVINTTSDLLTPRAHTSAHNNATHAHTTQRKQPAPHVNGQHDQPARATQARQQEQSTHNARQRDNTRDHTPHAYATSNERPAYRLHTNQHTPNTTQRPKHAHPPHQHKGREMCPTSHSRNHCVTHITQRPPTHLLCEHTTNTKKRTPRQECPTQPPVSCSRNTLSHASRCQKQQT